MFGSMEKLFVSNSKTPVSKAFFTVFLNRRDLKIYEILKT